MEFVPDGADCFPEMEREKTKKTDNYPLYHIVFLNHS